MDLRFHNDDCGFTVSLLLHFGFSADWWSLYHLGYHGVKYERCRGALALPRQNCATAQHMSVRRSQRRSEWYWLGGSDRKPYSVEWYKHWFLDSFWLTHLERCRMGQLRALGRPVDQKDQLAQLHRDWGPARPHPAYWVIAKNQQCHWHNGHAIASICLQQYFRSSCRHCWGLCKWDARLPYNPAFAHIWLPALFTRGCMLRRALPNLGVHAGSLRFPRASQLSICLRKAPGL